jgi:beta-glucosidase
LLRNESVLPLSKDIATIVVAGRGANDVGMQCGGWTISWQGGMGDITPGTTVLDGVQAMVSSSTQVVHSPDGTIVSNADAVIVVVGETPYAEMHGDRDNLVLSNEDIEVINTVKASGKPMVVVLLSGRPIIITDIIEEADAFLAAWLPGTEGNGITDVIFGDYSPTGKLSVTWPTDMSQIPINVGDSNYAPLFPVGYGLTY